MNFAHVYKTLNGRDATPTEVLKFERLMKALETVPSDALLAILVAFGHFETLYKTIPSEISKCSTKVLTEFKETAKETAKAALRESETEHARAIALMAEKVASEVSTKRMFRWIAGSIAVASICAVACGWYFSSRGEMLGFNSGYASGYRQAMDEKALASWANTPQGRLAHRMAEAGSLDMVAQCNGKGWELEAGVCWPKQAADGTIRGWRLWK